MKILGIETSCDETAVAIVDDTRKILAHEILSQSDHEAYGGVIPEVAARAHLQHMDRLIREAMTKARPGKRACSAARARIRTCSAAAPMWCLTMAIRA